MTDAVFAVDGDRFLPQPVSRAGWYDEVLHGGPVAALFARSVERVSTPMETLVTRLTVDLMRPVPVTPLSITTELLREGRRIQVVGAVMEADGTQVARATALRMRTAEVGPPDHPERAVFPDPAEYHRYDRWRGKSEGEWFYRDAVELRFVAGDFYEPGPSIAWMRMTRPLVEGEEPTPMQQVAAIADFGNGLSRVLGRGWLFINADLTIALHDQPHDEWIGLRSRTDIDRGVGLAQSELFDRHGAIGHALQSLFVDRSSESDGP